MGDGEARRLRGRPGRRAPLGRRDRLGPAAGRSRRRGVTRPRPDPS